MSDTPIPSDNAAFLSDFEADMLATYEHQLQAMADAVVDEGVDVEDQLAEMVETLPDSARTELVRRFREKVQAMQDAKGISEELTPEQEQQLELLKQYEQHYIAHMLSEKALEKIRRMLLSNPALIQHVLGVGDELMKKGVLSGRLPNDAVMESLTTQPTQTPQQKGQDSGKGRG